ncbi:hypothetical protein Ddye_023047 [Dipteronia dyeriana]|uniref:Transposase n=1 Tax=Dipteronia dyeriana TaxID=168575 RepID=A0AAD9TT48_9ROSI|nr:hypothetical protein Ddye_023047 [Dipteronia dyeriana]
MQYIPFPLTASSSDIPNPQPKFMTDLNEVDFSGFEETIFYSYGENDDVGENEHVGADELGDQIDLGVDLGGVELGGDYGVDLGVESDEMGGVPDLRELAVIPEVLNLCVGCQMRLVIMICLKACLAEKCPWRMHASIVGDETTMQVKTYINEHTCHRIYKSQEARSKWIASKFKVLVRNNPSIQCGVISNLLRDQFNAYVDLQRLYKAKRRALEVLLEEHTECFSHLRGPFIGIDGCHLKGPYGGVIRCKLWIMCCFLNCPEDRHVCFMSDRQKGVIRALKMYWPKASVRFCARHIYANFSTKYSGQKIRKLFWKASKTDDKYEFKKSLQDIDSINPQSMAYLAAIEPCHWSRHAFDNSIKCDHLRKEECSKWGNGIPPAVNKKIKENNVECRILRTLHSGQGKYEMLGAPIQPPPLKRKPGRPKLLRKRESTEKPKAKASKKNPVVNEDESVASSSKPSKKRQRAAAKQVDVGDNSSHPTTQVHTQPISQVTQLQ